MKGKITRTLSILLAVVLVTGAIQTSFAWWSGKVSADGFMTGAGIEGDPYIITTAEQFNEIRDNNLAGYYQLGSDIDLSGFANWEPFPNFAGTLDGNGYVISGLTINRAGEDYVGLFSLLEDNGELINIRLENVDVIGKDMVGALVGESWGNISNSYVSGGIVTGVLHTGGLIGYMNDGSLKYSYSYVAVFGDSNVGGLVGTKFYHQIEFCYSLGNVMGNTNVGGLVGLNDYSVTQSYAAGLVSGSSNTGGLVGKGDYGMYSRSYYDKETTGQNDTGKGDGMTTAELQSQSTLSFYYWDFDTVWFVRDGEYPKLRALEPAYALTFNGNNSESGTTPGDGPQPGGAPVVLPGNTGEFKRDGYMFTGWNTRADGKGVKYIEGDTFTMFDADTVLYANWIDAMSGSGTEADPYIVMTAEQLDAIRLQKKAFYKQGADIDLAPYTSNWNPIGASGTFRNFEGGFDGGGYVITGLQVNASTRNAGLFGSITTNSKISNVRLPNVNVSGTSHVGGLVGNSYKGIITDSYVTGRVTGTGDYVGGLVGKIEHGGIERSYASGMVSGASYVGGLLGDSDGYSPDLPRVADSYARVNVTGTGNYVGGVVGRNKGNVNRVYAVGSLTASGSYVGGVLGSNQYGIGNSYYDKDVTGRVVGVGEAKTTAQMKTEANYSDWDFATVWSIQEGSDYPQLRMFASAPTFTVTYVAADSTSGTAPIDNVSYPEGSEVTVADNTGNLARNGDVFVGWNTAQNGSGTAYAPGDKLVMGAAAVVLHAQWAPAPSYTIAALADQTLAGLTEGYVSGMQETRTITVTKTGTGDLNQLTASLVGADASAFEITVPAATSLNSGMPSTTFTIKAKDQLAAGTYTANVTVSADHMTDVSFTVTQTVQAAQTTVKGDANGDGIVSPADALMITQHLNGKRILTPEQIAVLDMNGDGILDNQDVKLIMDIYLGGQ